MGTSTKRFTSTDEKDEFVGTVDWGARKSGVVLKETLANPLQEDDESRVRTWFAQNA